jgi:hypothetical protein
MKLLLPAEILRSLPPLYATENVPIEEHILWVKFFESTMNWRWYGVEYEPQKELFFGYVQGYENEWGYFSLEELRSVKNKLGLEIERDLQFKPIKFSELIE